MLDGRNWFGVSGATAEDMAHLKAVAPDQLPAKYLALLAFSNGGEGPLAVQPYNLCLDPAMIVAETIGRENDGRADLQGFLFFGGNGGGEYLAFDIRGGAPWPVVFIDMIAGGDSAEVIAPDFDAFYDLIGIEAEAA